jgi:hypothetical protein
MLEVQKKLHVFGRNGPFANTPDPSELYIFSAPLPAARRYHQSRSRGRRFWSSHAARGYRYDANHATGVIIAYQARDQDGIKLNGVVQRVLDHFGNKFRINDVLIPFDVRHLLPPQTPVTSLR